MKLYDSVEDVSQTMRGTRHYFQKWFTDNVFLLSALLIYGTLVYFLVRIDSAPPKWDEAVHLRDSFVYHNILSDPTQLNFSVIKEIINKSDRFPLLRPSGYYPPLVPVVSALLFFVFGISAQTAIMSNLLFLFLLIFCVYKIGAHVFDARTGLLAAILLLLLPIILQHSVIYYLDLPLTALTSLGIYALLKTEYFKDTRISLITGICFGLGMLIKWTFLFFILGPVVYSIIVMLKNRSSETGLNRGTPVKNLFLLIAAAILTFGPYYIPILSQLIQETFKYSHGPLAFGPNTLFSIESITFYFNELWNNLITPLGFILFVSGIVYLSFSKNKYRIFMIVWTIIPYLIFTFIIHSKTPRYMMPWLIPVLLIAAYAAVRISRLNLLNRKIDIGRLVVPLISIVFGIVFFSEYLNLRESIITSSKENWNVKEIISVVQNDIRKSNEQMIFSKPLNLGTVPDHEYINGQTLRYYAALKKLPLNVLKLQDYSETADKKFEQNFSKYDYILIKSSLNSIKPAFQQSTNNMNNYFYSRITNFVCLMTFNEPDGSIVYIYKRKNPSLN